MKIFASIEDKTWEFEQIENNGISFLSKNKHSLNYEFTPLGNNRFVFILEGKSHLIHIIKQHNIYHVHMDGDYFPIRVEDARTRELRALVEHAAQAGGEHTLLAPIPGLITQIKVKEGESIQQGEGVIILEAMKMENEIRAEASGTVKKIFVKEGFPVEKDQEMIVIG